MTEKGHQRPPQVTLLGGAILVGSIATLALAFDQMASLGSIEAQQQAQDFVDAGVGRGLGIDANTWQSVLRVLCLVTGGVAVVSAFLGWQVLQRVRSARVPLTVLAPVLLFAGAPTADFVATTVVVAIVLLWRQPARDWLDGKAVEPPRPLSAPKPITPTTPNTPNAPAAQAQAQAPTYDAPPAAYPPPPPNAYYPQPARHAHPSGPTGSVRPQTVLTAGIITIVSSVLVLLASAATLLAIATSRPAFERELDAQLGSEPAYDELGLDATDLTTVVAVALGFAAVWAVAAIVLAAFTVRGSNGARIALVVSSFALAALSLLASAAVFPLVFLGLGVAVGVLLLRGDASAWFASRRTPTHP